jgi:hypothetical protein
MVWNGKSGDGDGDGNGMRGWEENADMEMFVCHEAILLDLDDIIEKIDLNYGKGKRRRK